MQKSKPSWDNESFTTDDLYNASKDQPDTEQTMTTVLETNEGSTTEVSNAGSTNNKTSEGTNNDDYTLVGTSGRVRWEFVLTAATTDKEIERTHTAKLLIAVAKVEKLLEIRVQEGGVSLDSREQARRARTVLGQEKSKETSTQKSTHNTVINVLTRNIALDMDTTVVQAPGLATFSP